MTDLAALGILAIREQCRCGRLRVVVTAVFLRDVIPLRCKHCGTVMEYTPQA